jgi:hypothetical protein
MYTIVRPGHGGRVPGGDPNGQQFMVNAAHMNGGQFFMPSPPLFYAPPGAPPAMAAPAMAGVPVPPPHPGGTPAPGWETAYPPPYGHSPQPRVLAVVPGYQHMQQMGGLPPGIQVTHMGPMGGIPPGVQMLLPPDQISHQGYRIVNQLVSAFSAWCASACKFPMLTCYARDLFSALRQHRDHVEYRPPSIHGG